MINNQSNPNSDDVPADAANDNQILEDLDDATNDTINPASPPSVLGEQAVSGDMPDPEADDDTLGNAQQVGIATEADYDEPHELNIAEDVDEAEEARRGGG